MENLWDIWRNNEARLYKAIYASTRNHADTEDILQDTLVKAIVGYEKLKDPRKVHSWLGAIATHTTVDFFRRRGREELWDIENFDHIISRYDVASDNKIVIEQFLDELPDEWRAVVAMKVFGDINAKQIAKITGGNYEAIRKRLSRTLRMMGKAISDEAASK